MKIIYTEKISSTNDYLKKLKKVTEDTAIIAKKQTGGRGTKGRSFICEEGGVYLSLLKLYPCSASQSFSIMENSALAVVKTLKSFGVEAGIKWPNDIIVNGKKICGILIENVFEGDEVARSVIGIGLNVNNPIANEIKEIAISTKEVLGTKLDEKTVASTILYHLYLPSLHEEYENHLLFLGEEVTVITEKSTYKAIIDKVLPNGNLQLKDGTVLSSAEVSIR